MMKQRRSYEERRPRMKFFLSSPCSTKLSCISLIRTHARDLPSNTKETTSSVKVQITGCQIVWSCETKSGIVVPNVSV